MVSQLQTISTISRSVTKGPHISLAGSTKQQGPTPMTGRTDRAQKGGQFNKPFHTQVSPLQVYAPSKMIYAGTPSGELGRFFGHFWKPNFMSRKGFPARNDDIQSCV